jgi:hypothetical protein
MGDGRITCFATAPPNLVLGRPTQTKVRAALLVKALFSHAAPAARACSCKLRGHFCPATRTSHVLSCTEGALLTRVQEEEIDRPDPTDRHQPPGATLTHSLLLTGRRRRAAIPVHYFNRTPFLVLHSCSIVFFLTGMVTCACVFLLPFSFFQGMPNVW